VARSRCTASVSDRTATRWSDAIVSPIGRLAKVARVRGAPTDATHNRSRTAGLTHRRQEQEALQEEALHHTRTEEGTVTAAEGNE
jgi:predicted deacetylase